VFISKKRHEEIVRYWDERLADVREGYQAQITLLKEQVRQLERLALPPTSYEIPRDAREADAIISITERPIKTETDSTPEDIREFDNIMSGSYEDFY